MFDQECSELPNNRKQAKLLWQQNPNDQTAEDFSNLKRNTCRTFKKMKRDYMKAKVNKLEENSNNKNIWEMYKGINEFKKDYQPRVYVIKKHDGRIEADRTSILNIWEKLFSNLLKVNQSVVVLSILILHYNMYYFAL